VVQHQRAEVKMHYLQGSEDMAMEFSAGIPTMDMNQLLRIEPGALEVAPLPPCTPTLRPTDLPHTHPLSSLSVA